MIAAGLLNGVFLIGDAVGVILIIVVLVLLFGGGGGYYAHRSYGMPGLGGVLGLIAVVLIVLWLVGGLHTGGL
jgi:hypothetical protein